MPIIEKGQSERIDKSIALLRHVCEVFDTLPRHEREADLNFLLDKYVHNPDKSLIRRDAAWRWSKNKRGYGK